MEVEAVGADALDHAVYRIDRDAVIELDGTDVCEEHDVRRDVAHAIRRQQCDVFERRALAPEGERDSRTFGCDREIVVDHPRTRRAARHR